MKNGPWVIKERVSKYSNPWIEVFEDKVVRPDGKDGIFGFVKMLSGVSVLPMDSEGFVYLAEEFRYAVENKSVEAVSGGIDEGESALECAKRELKEELGIIAKDWVDLGVVNPFTSVVKSGAFLFLARDLEFMKNNREGTEVIKLVKVKFDVAVKMVLDSKITHGPTCVLTLKAKEFLRQ